MFSILKNTFLASSSPFLFSCSAILGSFAFLITRKLMKAHLKNSEVTAHAVVVITGCDSGLGYSMALHCHEIGYYVFAAVLNCNSPGADALNTLRKDKGNISIIKLDITNSENINNVFTNVTEFLDDNQQYYLHAIINNAGVMVFGEFEWLTDKMIWQLLNVNLFGTINFTKVFIPLLRKYKGRIINISSHCAKEPLPGLSVYAASKSGLHAWNDAIRVEYAKYEVKVISFLPGSFFLQSNILSKQSEYGYKMKANMTKEAIEFYGDYFDKYQAYIGAIAGEKPLQKLQDEKMYYNLSDALISKTPSPCYYVTPFRYGLYHFLFRISPTAVRDYFVEKFMNMPTYTKL